MTTKNSPRSRIKAQADEIARRLKAAERGEQQTDVRFAEKIVATRRNKDALKFGIVMDDKIISIEMPWEMIRDTSEAAMSEYIVKQMMEVRHV